MNFDVYAFLEKDFYSWCSDNFLQVENIGEHIFKCGDKTFLLLEEKEGNVCDTDYHFILNSYEKSIVNEVDAVVYKWGTKYCYTNVAVMDQPDNDNVKDFKYIGTTTLNVPGLPFLGIHGQYEILNGSRNYGDWAAKAKFLQIPTLGICEKNTLAGTMAFQQACQKKEIKSILGETITISNGKDLFFEGRIFALSHKGWQNVLQTNAEINVINLSQFVQENRLLELGEGVAFVFDPLTCPYNEETIKKYQKAFDLCYFKLDTVQYENDKTDQTLLESTQKYLNNTLGLKPILLCDAYYLDKEDYEIKKDLNLIAGVKSAISHNQYFKSDDENLILLSELFKEEDYGEIVQIAIDSLLELDSKGDWTIPTRRFHIPKYQMNEQEKAKYKTTDDLFDALIMEGWEKYKLSEKPNVEVYLDRLQEEADVIRAGGFIDYFLILHDIIRWCKENDILVGVGRGSAAGSLCAWLLDLTKIDPIEYNLLFERFLNKGRIFKQIKVKKVKVNQDTELDFDERVSVFRDNNEITIRAHELQKGDQILNIQSHK